MHELNVHAVLAEQRRQVRTVEERYRRYGRPVRQSALPLHRRRNR
jgi:hypothetical protein